MPEAVIIEAVRTPFCRRNGGLREFRPDSLLGYTLERLCERARFMPDRLDDVIAGCVIQAGEQAANIGRLAVMLSGFPARVPAVTLNRMCGSSQQAVHFGAQSIAAGDSTYVIGCGVANMTRVPMFLDITLGDEYRGFERLNPTLFSRYELIHQVESAERIAEKWRIGRPHWMTSRESHRRAHAAAISGCNKEIIVIRGVNAEGRAIEIAQDEGIRASWDAAKTAALKPVVRASGHGAVTAANLEATGGQFGLQVMCIGHGMATASILERV